MDDVAELNEDLGRNGDTGNLDGFGDELMEILGPSGRGTAEHVWASLYHQVAE